MRRTIYLSDALGEQVTVYLKEHPGLTLSALVQEVLEDRVAPRDLRALLDLAGIVTEARTSAGDRAEDEVLRYAR